MSDVLNQCYKLPAAGPYVIYGVTNRRHSPSRDTCKIIGIETSHENMKQIKYKPIYSFKDWSNFILQHILIVFIYFQSIQQLRNIFRFSLIMNLLKHFFLSQSAFSCLIFTSKLHILLCHLLILNVY